MKSVRYYGHPKPVFWVVAPLVIAGLLLLGLWRSGLIRWRAEGESLAAPKAVPPVAAALLSDASAVSSPVGGTASVALSPPPSEAPASTQDAGGGQPAPDVARPPAQAAPRAAAIYRCKENAQYFEKLRAPSGCLFVGRASGSLVAKCFGLTAGARVSRLALAYKAQADTCYIRPVLTVSGPRHAARRFVFPSCSTSGSETFTLPGLPLDRLTFQITTGDWCSSVRFTLE